MNLANTQTQLVKCGSLHIGCCSFTTPRRRQSSSMSSGGFTASPLSDCRSRQNVLNWIIGKMKCFPCRCLPEMQVFVNVRNKKDLSREDNEVNRMCGHLLMNRGLSWQAHNSLSSLSLSSTHVKEEPHQNKSSTLDKQEPTPVGVPCSSVGLNHTVEIFKLFHNLTKVIQQMIAKDWVCFLSMWDEKWTICVNINLRPGPPCGYTAI